jgi:RimJ/RimL family protein N-acetyltransferase
MIGMMRPDAHILETNRLLIRRLDADDAAFILRLVTDPAWLRFIGDKGIRTLEDAREYIQNGPVTMNRRLGFGLYLVENQADGQPMGICGFIRRDGLDDVDLGFALLPEYRGQGYAFEAAAALMVYGASVLGLSRVAAITTPENDASAKLLEKLGFRFDRVIRLAPDAAETRLYVADDLGSARLPR